MQAVTGIDTALVRAFVLRVRSLELRGDTAAHATAARELGESLMRRTVMYQFDMDQEPVLSVTGMHRPALTGVDMKLYDSPVSRLKLAQSLAAKKAGNGMKE